MKRHDFRLGERIVERGIPDEWGRVDAECRRCRERRRVFAGVPMDLLNAGRCPVGRIRSFFYRWVLG